MIWKKEMNSEKIKFTGNTKSFRIIKSKAVHKLLHKELSTLSKLDDKMADEIQF